MNGETPKAPGMVSFGRKSFQRGAAEQIGDPAGRHHVFGDFKTLVPSCKLFLRAFRQRVILPGRA
jgi:hypothetical protein